MDPMTMIMLANMGVQAYKGFSGGGMGGKDAEQSSSFGKGQLSNLEKAMESIRGGAPNINENPQYQQGQEWLNSLFNDPEFFKNMEAPAMRQYEEQTIPDLANRFASMGSGGSTGSTAFRNQLGREGSNLQSNLAAMRGGMQQQGANQALQYAQQPFNNYSQILGQTTSQPTMNQYKPATAGFWGDIGSSMFGGAAQGYGNKWGQQQAGGNGLFPGQSPSTGGGGGGYGAGWDNMFRNQGGVY